MGWIWRQKSLTGPGRWPIRRCILAGRTGGAGSDLRIHRRLSPSAPVAGTRGGGRGAEVTILERPRSRRRFQIGGEVAADTKFPLGATSPKVERLSGTGAQDNATLFARLCRNRRVGSEQPH